MRPSSLGYRCAIAITGALYSAICTAGVTIHYEGAIADQASMSKVFAVARATAGNLGWPVAEANVREVSLPRWEGGFNTPYKGPLVGIRIAPHPDSEPLEIQFGTDGKLQSFIKTQFAGPDIHIEVISLLRAIQPYFSVFSVSDEGEYWETRDRQRLEANMEAVFRSIEFTKKQNPGVRGPIRIQGGRIVDLTQ